MNDLSLTKLFLFFSSILLSHHRSIFFCSTCQVPQRKIGNSKWQVGTLMEPEYKMEEEPTCFYLISSMNPSMAASHCLSQSPFQTSVFPQFANFTSKPTLKSVLDTLPLPYNFKPTQCKLNLREVLSQNPAEAITTSVPKTQKFQHCFTKSDDGYLYCDDLRVQDVMETGERRPFYAVLVLLGSGNELLFASTAKRNFRNGDRKTLDDLVLASTGGVFVDLERVSDFDGRVSAVRIAEKKINYPQLGTTGPFLYTSESVTEGHPDKLCDQIADTILDGCLELDPDSKVGCKACIKNNKFMVFGEVTTKARVDYEKIVRDTCRDVGYVSEEVGLDANHCEVLVNIEQQSPDIARGVHSHPTIAQGVLVFGYATDETPEMMPLGQVVANKATASMDRFRKKGTYPWLGPAGKVRVTCEYSDVNGAMVPVRVLTVDIITQHDGTVTKDEINAAEFMEHVIKPVIPEKYLDEKTNFHLILSNQFVPGGPCGHAGHTGRQIMADKYGGLVPLFGGDFSGKDPSKVERCGAYIARQAAKSIVANGLARRCIVYLLYAIGEPEPLSVIVDTYGTGKILNKEISKIVKKNFDFRPGMIAINLDLKRGRNGRFSKTAVYGHFGRDDPDFTWEVVKNLN